MDVPLLIYPGHVKYTCHKEECNEYCSELIQERYGFHVFEGVLIYLVIEESATS